MDVLLGDDQLEQQLMDEEGLEEGWITDHLGVRGDFIVLNRDKQVGTGLENIRSLPRSLVDRQSHF